MTDSRGPVRRFMTRALAAGVLLGIYTFSTIAVTGVVIVAGTSPAMAQRGRGRGGRGGGGRGRGGGGVGAAIGAGIAIGVIGGAIAADQARRGNGVNYCLSRYRSYDPQSGTYLGNDGYRHTCP